MTVFTVLESKTGKTLKVTIQTIEKGKGFFGDGVDLEVFIGDRTTNFLSVANFSESLAIADEKMVYAMRILTVFVVYGKILNTMS